MNPATPPANLREQQDLRWEGLLSLLPAMAAPANGPAAPDALLLATTKGDFQCQQAWMRSLEPFVNPPLLHESAGSIARQLGVRGPAWVVSAACASGLVALTEAVVLLEGNEAECVAVVAADVAWEFVCDGFSALKAIAGKHARPFDAQRDGLIPGSAVGYCLVNPNPANADCRLAGWGVANDAMHLTAPDRNAGGLICAIRQALEMAGIEPAAIDAIVAHGTGTRFNDAMEAVAIRTLFKHQPWITGVKGLIGHTMGASGLVETVLAARALAEQVLPPIIGMQASDFPDLRLVIREPVHTRLKYVLKTASGFGGMNAAIVLQHLGTGEKH